ACTSAAFPGTEREGVHDSVREGARPRQRLHRDQPGGPPGADRHAPDRADLGLRILNPDGSEAEKSGNGLRIFAKYLWDHGHAKREVFTVSTKGGRVECRCHVVDGRMN